MRTMAGMRPVEDITLGIASIPVPIMVFARLATLLGIEAVAFEEAESSLIESAALSSNGSLATLMLRLVRRKCAFEDMVAAQG